MSQRKGSPTLLRAALLLSAVCAASGCSNSDDSLELVTVSGIVRNIDTGVPAAGVVVRLLDTQYADEVETGVDGAYSIRVPKDSQLLLFTDDSPAARADQWFPFINVEFPPAFADGNITDWSIHCCPKTAVPELGSVAAWDHYLENGDPNNGDMFAPANSETSAGIIALLFLLLTSAGDAADASDFHIEIDAPEFPAGYADAARLFNQDFIPDWSLGPDMMYPATVETTDPGGVMFSFGDPSFTGTSVTLTIEDRNTSRNKSWLAQIEVPVRPGTISMVLPCCVDDIVNRPASDCVDILSGG